MPSLEVWRRMTNIRNVEIVVIPNIITRKYAFLICGKLVAYFLVYTCFWTATGFIRLWGAGTVKKITSLKAYEKQSLEWNKITLLKVWVNRSMQTPCQMESYWNPVGLWLRIYAGCMQWTMCSRLTWQKLMPCWKELTWLFNAKHLERDSLVYR